MTKVLLVLPVSDDVRQVLNADGSLELVLGIRKSPKPRPRITGQHPQLFMRREEYVLPILKMADELGGAPTTRQMRERLRIMLQDRFTPADLANLKSNEPKWWNEARFARNQMVEDGLLDGSIYGRWIITQKGRKRLAQAGRSK